MKIKDLFKQPVYPIKLYDKDDNLIYYKELNGFWWKAEYLDGKEVYYEDSKGFWWKTEYLDGNIVYFEDSNGFWYKQEYLDGNIVYFEDSNGYWYKRKYIDGNIVYFENSNGIIKDNRPKKEPRVVLFLELTMDEIATKFGIPVEQLKIKK
jgi:hypothetical protein